MTQNDLFNTAAAAPAAEGSVEIKPSTGTNLFDKAVLLSITFSKLGVARKVSSNAVECDADKSMLHLSKDILQSPILDEINKFDNETRGWISARALPGMFRSGTYLWPIGLVLQAEEYLQGRRNKRQEKVERFMMLYHSLKFEAQERLKSLFDPRQYPSESEVRAKFGVNWEYVEVITPGSLKTIDQALFEASLKANEERWKHAEEQALAVLVNEFLGLVDHMAESLKPGDDGKAKRFKQNSMIANFNQFFELFPFRNITNNSELAAKVDECKAMLAGVNPADLKSSEALRDAIQGKIAGIKEGLGALVVVSGRKIDLEDSEASSDEWGDI